ncbi:EI24 domain-containing protein [Sediminitomix flava]|uniref:Uncharacterized protein involved in cysteine biosynthesis n=1 Tax=Sediminitomix flava TaxID=379075 RepID=A0A315ZFY7_SEDFL|nr:EI24 domain-containing protein [Sediminitomix flava]PWJ43664.1 uncharacterized protein involved in cysteine biosynthesis [Sediminitomix flava]
MFSETTKDKRSSATFISALRTYPLAIKWLFADGKKYLFHFGVIALLVILLLGFFASQTSYWTSQWLSTFFSESYGGEYGQYYTILTGILIFIPLIWISTYLYKTLYLLFAGSYINLFGEHIYSDLLKKPAAKISFGSALRSFWIISIPIIFIEVIITTLLGGISLIPVIGIPAAILGMIMSSYFWGASMFDLYRETSGVDIPTRKRDLKSNKMFSIGNGIGFFLLLLIPIAGLFIAPAASFVAAFMAADKAEISR